MGNVKASIREEYNSGPDYLDAVATALADAYLKLISVSFKNGPDEHRAITREIGELAARYERAKTVRYMVAETGETLQGLRRTLAVAVAEADLKLRDISSVGEGYEDQIDEVNRSRDRYQTVVSAIADGYR
jgi:hypothetical protein